MSGLESWGLMLLLVIVLLACIGCGVLALGWQM
jgi:hypothetical protein